MLIATDTESTGLSIWHGHKPFGIGIAFENQDTDYIDFPVDPYKREVLVPDAFYLTKIPALLENPEITKVFFHAKHDIRMFKNINIDVRGPIHDVSIAARCVYTLEESVKLKPLAKKYIDIDDEDEQILNKKTQEYNRKAKDLGFCLNIEYKGNYWILKALNPDNNLVERYCRKDCLRTLLLWYYYEEAMQEMGVRHTYDQEMKLLDVTFAMEWRGIQANLERIKEGIVNCEKRRDELAFEITSRHGTVDLDKPLKLGKYLVENCGIPIREVTPEDKNIATDAPTLKRYLPNPVIIKLLSRKGYKTVGGYYKNYEFHNRNGRVHTSLKQWDTRTFRFSCVEPNLQNVANPHTSDGNVALIKEDVLTNARSVFEPTPGYIWLDIDYKQLELRIFASRGNVENLLKGFEEGDPHDNTRRNCPFLASKPKDQGRKVAKNTNFTVINMGGADVLYEKYNIPIEEAEIVIREFHNANPEAKKRGYELQKFASKYGYILNAYNDRLYVPKEYSYRGTSYDIQSSAGRQIKRAMIKLAAFFQKRALDAHLLLQVHDELIIEIDKRDFSNDLVKDIVNIMEDHGGAYCLPTPVDVSIVTENWGKKEEWKPNNIVILK